MMQKWIDNDDDDDDADGSGAIQPYMPRRPMLSKSQSVRTLLETQRQGVDDDEGNFIDKHPPMTMRSQSFSVERLHGNSSVTAWTKQGNEPLKPLPENLDEALEMVKKVAAKAFKRLMMTPKVFFNLANREGKSAIDQFDLSAALMQVTKLAVHPDSLVCAALWSELDPQDIGDLTLMFVINNIYITVAYEY